MQRVLPSWKTRMDIDQDGIGRDTLGLLLQLSPFVIRETSRIIVGNKQASDGFAPHRMNLPFRIAFPAESFFQRRDHFVRIGRAIRPDRMTLLEQNRPDKELALRIMMLIILRVAHLPERVPNAVKPRPALTERTRRLFVEMAAFRRNGERKHTRYTLNIADASNTS